MRSAAVFHLGSSGARSAASYHRGPFGQKSPHPTADPPHRPGPGTAPIPLTSLHFQNEGILEHGHSLTDGSATASDAPHAGCTAQDVRDLRSLGYGVREDLADSVERPDPPITPASASGARVPTVPPRRQRWVASVLRCPAWPLRSEKYFVESPS